MFWTSPGSPGVAREARKRARARSRPFFLSRRAARAPERRRGVSALPSNVFVRFRSSPGTARERKTRNFKFLSKIWENRRSRKNEKSKKKRKQWFTPTQASKNQKASVASAAPRSLARRAFSRRRPPFEHFHSVFLSIPHGASQKRARAKRGKTRTPLLLKSSNGGNASSGLLGFAGAPRRAPGERSPSAPRVLLECSMPFARFHVFHTTK